MNKIDKKRCIVIGSPVKHSKSPAVHEFFYKAYGLQDFEFLHYEIDLGIDGELDNLRKYIVEHNVVGISVTTPNKQHVLSLCDEVSEDVQVLNAVNSVVVKNGNIYGYNTDWIGIVGALESKISLYNKKIAILGAGSTTAAAIYGLKKYTQNIKIFNRTIEKAAILAGKFDIDYESINDIDVGLFDVIVNTTTVGLSNPDLSPINTDKISSNHIVFDVVYNPLETKLLREAKQKGAEIVYGTSMLINLIIPQFKLYTGVVIDKEQVCNMESTFCLV